MATIIYQGKLGFSELAPGLNDAADYLNEQAGEIEEWLTSKQQGVQGLQNKVTAMQNELSRAQAAAAEAQSILNDANSILEAAKDLATNLADALSTSGIYHYNYVGQIGDMGGTVSGELGGGLPDRNEPTDSVAAILLIVGGDGGTAATIEKISSLFGQIGNNAQDIIALYDPE